MCRVYSLRPIPLSIFVLQYSFVVLLPVMDGPWPFLQLFPDPCSCPVGLFPRLHSSSEGAAGFFQDLCRGALKPNERTSGDVISCSLLCAASPHCPSPLLPRLLLCRVHSPRVVDETSLVFHASAHSFCTFPN